MSHNGNKYLLITGQKQILEQLISSSYGLYQTTIRPLESRAVMNQKFNDPKSFLLWHELLGHPRLSMMCRITKIASESPEFLERIQGDICGPMHPSSRPFRYFMVLIDVSTRWSHVCLLSTQNVAFSRLLAQIIRLRVQFPDHPIKTIRLDNAGEFLSQAFIDYYMSIRIDVQYLIGHVHIQNGLVESFIKRLQLIARPLFLNTKLPLSTWGHAIIYAANLIRLHPTSNQDLSLLQLVLGYQPNISHLHVFGCAVYVPLAPTHRTKLGHQRRLSIYIGFQSSFIINYIEPLIGEVFTTQFAYYHFNENVFLPLGERKPIPEDCEKLHGLNHLFLILTLPQSNLN